MATLFSLILLVLLTLTGQLSADLVEASSISLAQLITGAVLIGVSIFTYARMFPLLQTAEENGSPHVSQLFARDAKIRIGFTITVFFGFLSIAFAVTPQVGAQPMLVFLWLILFGFSVDLTALSLRWYGEYSDPFFLVERYGAEASRAMGSNGGHETTPWIDALSTQALTAVESGNFSLARESINRLIHINLDLMNTKLLRAEDPATDPEMGYVLSFTYERLSLIHRAALEMGHTPVSSILLSALAKQAVSLAKRAERISTLPIVQLAEIAADARDAGYPDIMDKASFALVEVAKAALQEADPGRSDLTDCLASVVAHLEEIATEIFKHDKEVELQILVRPLKEIELLFKDEKYQERPDVKAVKRDLDRVFTEFAALGMVMLKKQAAERKESEQEESELESESGLEPEEEPVIDPLLLQELEHRWQQEQERERKPEPKPKSEPEEKPDSEV